MGIRRIPLWISAILLSLIFHLILFTGASLLYERNGQSGENTAIPLAVRITPQQRIPPARSPKPIPEALPEVDSEAGSEPARDSTTPDSSGENNPRGEPSGEPDNSGNEPVPFWKIDVPPKMIESGSMGENPDIIVLLDALPMTAAVYLDSTGQPYLVLYDPDPPDKARPLLNRFFTSARFTPAMAGDLYVPSVLLLPLEIKGLEPG